MWMVIDILWYILLLHIYIYIYDKCVGHLRIHWRIDGLVTKKYIEKQKANLKKKQEKKKEIFITCSGWLNDRAFEGFLQTLEGIKKDSYIRAFDDMQKYVNSDGSTKGPKKKKKVSSSDPNSDGKPRAVTRDRHRHARTTAANWHFGIWQSAFESFKSFKV